jgi:BirA family biotin operon repressor/biotin-[acetyl-CoA-carboxylase] ligase
VRLKWPSDVLLEHGASAAAKIAGILLEAAALDLPPGGMPSAMTPSGVSPWVVLGIGINLRQAPSGLTYAATSLADVLAPLGLAPPPPEAAYARLATALGAWLALWEKEGFAPLRAAWLRRGPVPGTPLAVAYGDSTRRGTFHDLAPDGALVLATAEGLWQARAGVVT